MTKNKAHKQTMIRVSLNHIIRHKFITDFPVPHKDKIVKILRIKELLKPLKIQSLPMSVLSGRVLPLAATLAEEIEDKYTPLAFSFSGSLFRAKNFTNSSLSILRTTSFAGQWSDNFVLLFLTRKIA